MIIMNEILTYVDQRLTDSINNTTDFLTMNATSNIEDIRFKQGYLLGLRTLRKVLAEILEESDLQTKRR